MIAHTNDNGQQETLPTRCPRCDDALQLYHTSASRPHHFLGCTSYLACSFTMPYDPSLHAILEHLAARVDHLAARVTRVEAHQAWLLVLLETLLARIQEGVQWPTTVRKKNWTA
jgi:ssDNA-binding Zn-finger/Zn-ribbon topoisomerase 1